MNQQPLFDRKKGWTQSRLYHRISCGCCTGDGTGAHSGNDQCVCAFHQDAPRGEPAKVCAYHATFTAKEKA